MIRTRLLAALLLLALLTACGSAPQAATEEPTQDTTTEAPAPATDSASAPTDSATAFPLTIENCGVTQTYAAPPERAVTMNQHATEVLLALGLEERMVGTAYLDDAVLPEFEAAYAAIPVLSDEYPALEVLLAAQPDFVYGGFRSAFSDDSGRTRDALEAQGINSFLSTEYCADGPVTMEVVYNDLRSIGAIFDVPERAEALIAEMQAQIAAVQAQVDATEPVRVFVYDSGEQAPFTAGGNGISNAMIQLAGGVNVFADIERAFGEASWEEVVRRDPEVILIYDYGDTSAEQKRAFLLDNPALRDITAIQQERFAVLPLSSTVAGVRNPAAVQQIAEALHGIPAGAASTTSAGGPVTIENYGRMLTFTTPPQRAVSLNLHTTEIMLALGLEDVMVGTAFNNNVILPELETAYTSIPVLADRYPSLEVLLSVNPDFVYGRTSAFGEQGIASVEELERLGITAYAVQGTVRDAATMEDVFADIRNLGRIFAIEQRAEALVAEMEDRIAAIQATIDPVDQPVRVLVYDAGESDLFTAGQSLQTHLIELAGGRNVFDDVETNWTTVSWEEAVQRQPDVIVINDYGDTSAETKIAFLLNNPALAEIPAIRNQRFVVLPLPSVFEGVRNPSAVETLARGFYPEAFSQ